MRYAPLRQAWTMVIWAALSLLAIFGGMHYFSKLLM